MHTSLLPQGASLLPVRLKIPGAEGGMTNGSTAQASSRRFGSWGHWVGGQKWPLDVTHDLETCVPE